MKLQAYSLFDSAIGAYAPPFFLRAHGEAVRGVLELVSDNNTQVSRNPADYSLFHIGEYNDETGTLSALNPKICLGSAHDLKTQARLKTETSGALETAPEILDTINNRPGKDS